MDDWKEPSQPSEPKQPVVWWRWPLLPFACVLGATVGSVLMGLFQWFGMRFMGGFREDGWYYLYILPIITSATFGYLFVFIAYEVAPTGKKTSAIVLTTLLTVIVTFTTFLALNFPDYSTGEKVQSVLGALAVIIAAIVTIIDKEQEYKSKW